MSKSFTLNWEDHLANSSRLCVFVGGGVSMGCKNGTGKSPGSWEDLLNCAATKYGCEQKIAFKNLSLPEKAEIIERERKKQGASNFQFLEYIESVVDKIDGNYVNPSSVHPTIADINPDLIVTTNYDRILERYLNEGSEPGYNVWTYPGRVEQIIAQSSCTTDSLLGDFLRSGEPLLLKIHGGVPSPYAANSLDGVLPENFSDDDYQIVLSETSYYKAYNSNGEIPSLLRAIFSTCQVIFIGYSLRDGVLRDILQSAGSLKGNRFRHVILQSPQSVVSEDYQSAFEEIYGVAVGTYSTHEKLAAGLHGLKLARD
ncbi:SIR2 family NAD-dependent protein deacylase [Kocuria rhizophila]|uniref:SIR2 family NAD-dependent protein deacylase n=1 Tax=Kocuria rhizophila TaxID=72000 RepID=UPI00128F8CA9|nr:SIR2 family protein [Kocuria rhizophila]